MDYGNLGGEMFQKHLMFLLGSGFWILLSTGMERKYCQKGMYFCLSVFIFLWSGTLHSVSPKNNPTTLTAFRNCLQLITGCKFHSLDEKMAERQRVSLVILQIFYAQGLLEIFRV